VPQKKAVKHLRYFCNFRETGKSKPPRLWHNSARFYDYSPNEDMSIEKTPNEDISKNKKTSIYRTKNAKS
jgi:hypothetical protein